MQFSGKLCARSISADRSRSSENGHYQPILSLGEKGTLITIINPSIFKKKFSEFICKKL